MSRTGLCEFIKNGIPNTSIAIPQCMILFVMHDFLANNARPPDLGSGIEEKTGGDTPYRRSENLNTRTKS